MDRTRRFDRLWHRLLLRLLPALLVAVGFAQGILAPSVAQASTAHPNAKSSPALSTQPPPDATKVDVLLLHGLEGYAEETDKSGANCTNPTNDPNMTFVRWDGFYQINGTNFAGISFSSNLIHPLKYFTWDNHCGPGLPGGSDDGDIGNDPIVTRISTRESLRQMMKTFVISPVASTGLFIITTPRRASTSISSPIAWAALLPSGRYQWRGKILPTFHIRCWSTTW